MTLLSRFLTISICLLMASMSKSATYSIVFEGVLTNDLFGSTSTNVFTDTGWSSATTFRSVGVYDTGAASTVPGPNTLRYNALAAQLQIGSEFVDVANLVVDVGDNLECCTIPSTFFDLLYLQGGLTPFTIGGIEWDLIRNYAQFDPSTLSSTALPTSSPVGTILTGSPLNSVFQLESRSPGGPPFFLPTTDRLLHGVFTSVTVVAGDARATQPAPDPSPIPLPAGAILIATGLATLAGARRVRSIS